MQVNSNKNLNLLLQEALRIDPTRADLLSSYASYLLTLPERIKEAEKYYNLAIQANPHDEELKGKYRRFHENRRQRTSSALSSEPTSSTSPHDAYIMIS